MNDERRITEKVYELKRMEKGKNVYMETRNSTIPHSQLDQPRKHTNLVSFDTEKLKELTDTPHTTSSSSSPHKKLVKKDRLLSLFKTKPTRFKMQQYLSSRVTRMLCYVIKFPVYVCEGFDLERQKAKEDTERLIAKAILHEHGNIQAQISTQIENAIANAIPSQVEHLPDYKNLNKNDIEDIYLLIMNGKVPDYAIQIAKVLSPIFLNTFLRWFTYEVEVTNIPCNSTIDDDSEDEADDDMGYDPSDVAFIEWLRSKIFNYKTTDQYTMKALWIYWIRGDDEVELTDEESSDNKDEIAEVFRIDTNIFDYETPICLAFNEFNYLLKDYEWYEALEDCKLKDLALRNKASMEGLISDDDDESCYEQRIRWNVFTKYDDTYEINDDGNGREELCEVHEPPVCNIRKYKMIKYSFNNDDEYVAVKEDEYDDLTITRKEACQAYQEILRIMDEGWMVTRAE
ncbi:hypothetical protein Tco_0572779 [Tanacetum coccineum]